MTPDKMGRAAQAGTWLLAILITALAVLGTACKKSAGVGQQGKSVLLITIDSWRWDHLGASGSGAVETPVLDALASEGMYIEKVQSSCPLTTPAHATIMTGLYPSRHGIRVCLHFRLTDGVPTLASLLFAAGYRCAAVVSSGSLKRRYGLCSGFADYDDSGLGNGEDPDPAPGRSAEKTTGAAIRKLAGMGAGERVFMWVHYADPHSPCTPPEPFLSKYQDRPYAGEVAFVDSQIGALLSKLPGGKERWNILITGDHGEALGDHGERTHGVTLYESVLEVPLILWPRPDPLPKQGGHPSLADVFPTICNLAGIAARECDGTSLLAGVPGERFIAAESAYPTLAFRVNPAFSLRRGDLVWLQQGAEEVYDLAADPGQSNDLSIQSGAKFADECRRAMAGYFGPDPIGPIFEMTISPDMGLLNELLALGYIGGTASARPPEIVRKDAGEFLRDLCTLQDARALFFKGEHKKALPLYETFLASYPDSAIPIRELGMMQMAGGGYRDAMVTFSRAVSLDPTDPVSSKNLGELYGMKGEFIRSESLLALSLKSDDGQPDVHLSLAKLYLGPMNRPDKAVKHIERFLELGPDDPEAAVMRAELARLGAAN